VDDGDGFQLEPVWLTDSFAHHSAAMAFWDRYRMLPRDVDPQSRARQIAVFGRKGDELAGIGSVVIRQMPQVLVKLAMFRCSVAPEHRRSGLAGELGAATRDVLEAWSLANPAQEVMGMGCVVQGPELMAKRMQPYWPITRMALAGYNDRGEQVRIVWFGHARVG
jgi:hypothetical protein